MGNKNHNFKQEPKVEVAQNEVNVQEETLVEDIQSEVQEETLVEDIQSEVQEEVKVEEPKEEETEDAPKVKLEGEINSLEMVYKALHIKSLEEVLKEAVCTDINEILFLKEIETIHSYVSLNEQNSVNKGNAMLNAVLLRVISQKDVTRFDIINKLFEKYGTVYEPSYLIRYIGFSNNIKIVKNYGLLVTIINLLADPATRVENKKAIESLENLLLDGDSLEFLIQYYML